MKHIAYIQLKSKVKFIVFVFVCSVLLSAQIQPSREYQIKAVFILNFAQFIEWPADAFSSAKAPLVIGILGKDPFGQFLQDAIQGEKSKGHPLQVKRFSQVSEVKQCHILFINQTKSDQELDVITSSDNQHVLTISDATDFIQQGGIVRFVTENNKIRFQINLNAARQNEITISSKLLRLAEIVNN